MLMSWCQLLEKATVAIKGLVIAQPFVMRFEFDATKEQPSIGPLDTE